MSSSSMPDNGSVVHFGGCWDGDHEKAIDCRVNAAGGCEDEGLTYRSSFLLFVTEHSGSDKHNECKAENVHDAAVKISKEGTKCSSQTAASIDTGFELLDGICTVGCQENGSNGGVKGANGSSITSNSSECNLLRDESSNTLTVYGACQNVATKTFAGCFYSSNDCENGSHNADLEAASLGSDAFDGITSPTERFLTPAEVLVAKSESNKVTNYNEKLYCDCRDVQVGACFAGHSYGYFCAVSSDSCGEDETFVKARDLPSFLDCRLCHGYDVSVEMLANTDLAMKKAAYKAEKRDQDAQEAPVPAPAPAPTMIDNHQDFGNDDNKDLAIGSTESNNNNNTPSASIIGVSVTMAGIAVLAVVFLLKFMATRRHSQLSHDISKANTSDTDSDHEQENVGEDNDCVAVRAGQIA